MTIKPTTSTDASNFMLRFWAWLKAVVEAVNYDPNEQLHRRVELLEARLGEREK